MSLAGKSLVAAVSVAMLGGIALLVTAQGQEESAAVPPQVQFATVHGNFVNLELVSEPDLERILASLGDVLERQQIPSVPNEPRLFVRAESEAALEELSFGELTLGPPEERDLSPRVRLYSESPRMWEITFDRPITGQILIVAWNDAESPAEAGAICAVQGTPPPDPEVVRMLEESARGDLAHRAREEGPTGAHHAVTSAVSDMRSVAVALEAYFVDWNAYPPHAIGGTPRSVAGSNALLRGLPTLTNCLTSPVAYISNRYPLDPFNPEPGSSFAYRTDGMGWILLSPGPDGVFDINPALYTSAKPQPAPELLVLLYDPTNGTVSGGDLIRTGP